MMLSDPHVVLRHACAHKKGMGKPYHVEPLARYIAHPPGNPAFHWIGTYPNVETALKAMIEDAKALRAQRKTAPRKTLAQEVRS